LLNPIKRSNSKMIRKLSVILSVAMAMMLAACGGGTGGGGGGGVTLGETFDADGLTFKYPTGWVVSPSAGPGTPISIANSQATLDANGAGTAPKLSAGQQGIVIIPLTGQQFTAMKAVAATPIDLLKTMTPGLSAQEDGITFSDPAEATIGGKPGAKATGSGSAADATILAINMGDDVGYVLLIGAAAKGEMGSLEGTLNGVAESIGLKPASS
jgi:hypothetical protein